MSDKIEQLKKPFSTNTIQWRIQRCGITSKGSLWAVALPYITSRCTMDRLDKVMGGENWKEEVELNEGNAKSKLSLKFDNEWVTKEGVAAETNIEATKGGASDALKRAGYKWGVGRYLYRLDEKYYKEGKNDIVRERSESGRGWQKGTVNPDNNKQSDNYVNFWWNPPELPDWAKPDEE